MYSLLHKRLFKQQQWPKCVKCLNNTFKPQCERNNASEIINKSKMFFHEV